MSGPAVSPLAPNSFPILPPVGGVRLATMAADLRYTGRDDLFLAAIDQGTAAGALTVSGSPSAPVLWCRKVIAANRGRAILVNAGNANAFTGQAGAGVVQSSAQAVAEGLGIEPDDVFISSTGVIGELPDADAIANAMPELVEGLTPSSPESWERAANAIRTTDTYAKGASAAIEGTHYNVVGIAKGSGMIAPNMATMLAYVFTDAPVAREQLRACTESAVAMSFNRITVDSDTSTSDTVLTFATGTGDPVGSAVFLPALQEVMLDLAHQIVRDGEGATKFIAVKVNGAASASDAENVARSIADSPLVKTALGAEDANWGRIIMAIGKAGAPFDLNRVRLWIGPELVAENGAVAVGYSEERATKHLQQTDIDVTVDLGDGEGKATVWTCDLTHGYIEINADYRS